MCTCAFPGRCARNAVVRVQGVHVADTAPSPAEHRPARAHRAVHGAVCPGLHQYMPGMLSVYGVCIDDKNKNENTNDGYSDTGNTC